MLGLVVEELQESLVDAAQRVGLLVLVVGGRQAFDDPGGARESGEEVDGHRAERDAIDRSLEELDRVRLILRPPECLRQIGEEEPDTGRSGGE